MLIVTAGSGDNYPYIKTITYCQKKAKEFGYGFVVYDFGKLGIGKKVDDLRCKSKFRIVRTELKPSLILECMNNYNNKTIVWIDGDATLIRSVDELDKDDSFDVAVTVRNKAKVKKTCYINAGVIVVKNNEAAKGFIKKWIDLLPQEAWMNNKVKPPACYSDQNVLEHNILLPNIDVIPWDVIGTIHSVCGARVKFLDCERYNNFFVWREPVEAPSKDVKILHFKGHKMNRLEGYLKDYVNE